VLNADGHSSSFLDHHSTPRSFYTYVRYFG
jgi:hypothetical protein